MKDEEWKKLWKLYKIKIIKELLNLKDKNVKKIVHERMDNVESSEEDCREFYEFLKEKGYM